MSFTDKSLMPFGKYEGTPLINISNRYLLWLYESKEGIHHKELREYVEDNLEVIRHEATKESYLDK